MMIAGKIMFITGILLTLLSMNFNPNHNNPPNTIIFTLGDNNNLERNDFSVIWLCDFK